MAVLADLTYKDSRTMRIATVIAMFHLPANLVMVCTSATAEIQYHDPRICLRRVLLIIAN